jgi:hypothetical protein
VPANPDLFKPLFVLFGDSITEFGAMTGGWQQLLTAEYVRKVRGRRRGLVLGGRGQLSSGLFSAPGGSTIAKFGRLVK